MKLAGVGAALPELQPEAAKMRMSADTTWLVRTNFIASPVAG